MGKAVLRWAVYWLVIIFLYVALSLYFGSFLYYAMLLVLALLYFLLRVLLFLPFRWVGRKKVRLIFYFAAVLASVVLTTCFAVFAVTEISSHFAISYIDSLD